ncbi:MAG: BspA family leucine-rich repeat surface protein [Prevotella sp.]|nr:BspA family leucine-rich repeat surface protein [Prevotella sp.]
MEPWMQEELYYQMERGNEMYNLREADEQEVRHMIEELNWICWEIEEAMNRQPSGEAEPYAVLSDNDTVLTFYYDNEKEARGGMDVGPFETLDTYSRWNRSFWNVEKVVFDNSFANCTSITSTANWFAFFWYLKEIVGLENLNTSNVKDMSYMFYSCGIRANNLILDLRLLNTSNVTNMQGMFLGCESTTFILDNFDTSNVTNMRDMFGMCCRDNNHTSIDISSFKTSNVTDMVGMFEHCYCLTTIYVGEGWDTSSVVNGDSIFTASPIVGGKGTKYDPDHVGIEYAHIDGGPDNPGYLTDKNAEPVESEAWFDGLTAWVYGDATLDDAFAEVGREEALKTIAAIVWESDNSLTDDLLEDITNPNLLVYCRDRSIAPGGVQNVIINGVAEQIILTDASGNNNFHCPQAFTAKNIGYTRNFSQTTEIGVSRGWETIALPFNVQGIFHELHGALVPFGGGNGGYPIWLHQLQGDGLTPVTAIEANTPYLICMPNNKVYPSAYNQAGNVTFVSSNVTVPETHPHEGSGAGVMLIPAFQNQDSSPDIYTLNVGEARDSYAEGSVFISNYRSVRPFQAYAVHTSQARGEDSCYIPLTSIGGGDGDTTGIMEIENGKLNIESWYSLDGRRLNAKPTKKGVYIQNGKKVVVK